MSLASTLTEVAAAPSETFELRDAQTLFAVWETSRQTVERLLPPPLRPAPRPVALGMLKVQSSSSIGPVYREALLGVRATAYEQEGFYFLSMPVTDSAALVFGRESLGYPRKVADIHFYRDGRHVGGWVQRHHVRYFAVNAHLTGTATTAEAQVALDELFEPAPDSLVMLTYSFKYFRSPCLDGFDYPPRLVCEEIEFRPRTISRGPASVSLYPSEYDPWSEVEVVHMLGAIYVEGSSSMRRGQVVSDVGPSTLASFAEVPVDLR